MKIQLSDHFTYRRLLRFVFPSIVMMVFTSIYGVVDGLFVSNFVGKDAFAAINLIMPFLMIFGGVGFMFGTGGSALLAMTLGEKKRERANEYFTMIVAGTAIVGAIISLIACFIMRPVAIWLGAEGEIITDCVIYGRIMMIFNIAFMLQNAFQGFFITAEKPHLGLVTTVAAGLTNMVLDALLVGVLKYIIRYIRHHLAELVGNDLTEPAYRRIRTLSRLDCSLSCSYSCHLTRLIYQLAKVTRKLAKIILII